MNRKDMLPEFVREALANGRDVPANDRADLESVLASFGGVLRSETPPALLKQRLLSAATAGPMRFAPFFDELGRLFDLGADAVIRVLERAGVESEWEPGPHPSTRIFHLEPGASLATADAGFVRMPAGFEWATHRHTAPEKVLILQGGYRENTGRIYRPGDAHEMSPGTEHAFMVLPDEPLLLALVLHGPIEML